MTTNGAASWNIRTCPGRFSSTDGVFKVTLPVGKLVIKSVKVRKVGTENVASAPLLAAQRYCSCMLVPDRKH